MQIEKKIKNRGISLVELVVGIGVSALIFQIMNPVVKGIFQIFEETRERSLGMGRYRLAETISWYADSSLSGKFILLDTTATLANRNIDLSKITAQEDVGNGVYIEIPYLCSKNGVWNMASQGYIFRFMENDNQGRHFRYVPVNDLRGGKEDIISSNVSKGFFFRKDGSVFIHIKERKGEVLEENLGWEVKGEK